MTQEIEKDQNQLKRNAVAYFRKYLEDALKESYVSEIILYKKKKKKRGK